MYEIRDWLYIGKYRETRDVATLQYYDITAMLQLAERVEHPDVTTLYVPVEDGYPLAQPKLVEGVTFIRGQKAAGKRVLVACGAGISRSTTFALAALKEEEGISLEEAFLIIKQQHPDAMPHPALWTSLCSYYGERTPFWEMWERVHIQQRQSDSAPSEGQADDSQASE